MSEHLADVFHLFAERECRGVSPLYEVLARGVAADPRLLALAARARPGQPPPNMLLAAVHALLLKGVRDAPLARFYPDLTTAPQAPAAVTPSFRAFCLAHEDAIVAILEARVVSTNEVARAACLLPAFAEAARQAAAPLHLIEVGASAGLLLNWDHYAYDYGDGKILGPPEATLTLYCEPRGLPESDQGAPVWPEFLPAIASRLGIDPNPLDPAERADAAWLRALIWPEQAVRAEHLEKALAIAHAAPPSLCAGSALDCLAPALAALPVEGAPCVFHAFTLNQFSPKMRREFERQLRAAAAQRPLWRIGLEWGAAPAPELVLAHYDGAGVREATLARCDPHGAWIEWMGSRDMADRA
ncbi:MAG: DUF2332 domain-containing protein [Alphaproteobacteria bacterium]